MLLLLLFIFSITELKGFVTGEGPRSDLRALTAAKRRWDCELVDRLARGKPPTCMSLSGCVANGWIPPCGFSKIARSVALVACAHVSLTATAAAA